MYRKYVQIIGKVSFRNDIEAQRIQPMGDNFDMDLYRKAVDLTTSTKYSHIFV